MRVFRGRRLLGSIFALLAFCGATSRAQDEQWFKRHTLGNRYEGLVERPDALRSFEILGFFGDDDVSGVASNGQLHILYFLPQGSAVSSFTVKEKRSETQYVMQPILEKLDQAADRWHTFEPWPVHDVLIPNHVQLSNLSVAIRLNNSAAPDMFAPAYFYADRKPARVEVYTIDFVSYRRVSSYRCAVLDSHGKPLTSVQCTIPGNPAVLEGSRPVQFRIPAGALPTGMITVHISGQYSNDETGSVLSADLHFIHQRLPE